MISPAKSDLLVIGTRLSAPLLAFQLAQQGARPRVFWFDESPGSEAPRQVLFIGNGEYFANARKVFGQSLAERVWDISTANFRRAASILRELELPCEASSIARYAASDRERDLQCETASLLDESKWVSPTREPPPSVSRFLSVLQEPALSLDPGALARKLELRLSEQGVTGEPIQQIISYERKGLDCEVVYQAHEKLNCIQAAVTIHAIDECSPTVLPWLDDKIIPVTLSSFTFASTFEFPYVATFFNAGADFAFADKAGLRLGSYRNLFEDRAIGKHRAADPVTRDSLTKYFGGLGWIAHHSEAKAYLAYESLSCDGLPLAGSLPDLPGVYFVGGFAARTPNFLFEVGHLLSAGIVKGGDFSALDIFSTKRFV